MSCETCEITPAYKETEKWQENWVGLDVIAQYNGYGIGQETTSLGCIVTNDHLGQIAIEKIIRN